MTRATVSQSNLGGAGPDHGKKVLTMQRVGTYGGVYFDLEVAAASVYQPANVSSNGMSAALVRST